MEANSATTSRRQMLKNFASGFGMLGLANLLSSDVLASSIASPHIPAKAKRVIFLFMSGGPSHVALFDPKPKLQANSGKPLPFEMPKLIRTKTGNMLGSPYKFKKHGQSGIEVSELFPNVASCIDDICGIPPRGADNIKTK